MNKSWRQEAGLIAGCGLVLALLLAPKWQPQTGLTSLIQFGQDWEAHRVPQLAGVPYAVRAPTGYDGQFYAQIALDPLVRDPAYATALDNPPYRARRILLPALGYAIGAGEPRRIIAVFPYLNIAFWLALLVGLAWMTRPWPFPERAAAMVACVFSTGALESLRLSLSDLPMAVLAFFGAMFIWRGWRWTGGLLLACGGLARETGLVAAGAVEIEATGRTWRRQLAGVFLTVLPALGWFAWITYRFGGAAETGAGNFSWPVVAALGRARQAIAVLGGRISIQEIFTLVAIPGLYVQAVYFARRREWGHPLWRLGAAFATLLLFLGPTVWDVHMAACRAVLPMTLAFNWRLLDDSSRARWWWFAAGNAASVYALVKIALV